MKTYFDYESIIKSKDAAEAIAAPLGIGPFCGFGSATVSNNSITLNSNGEPENPLVLSIKDRIISRYITKSPDSGEAPDINFGCISRDGNIFISDDISIVIPNIEGSKGSNEDVLVFACHTPIEEPIQNPVQFRAFWNESISFYDLYKKSLDPLYPIAKSDRGISKKDVLEDKTLTYEYLSNRAESSISPGLFDKTSMVLIGIYGHGINPLTQQIETYAIVPYNGKFPQPLDYNTAIHGINKYNLETLVDILSGFPKMDIKAYIDEKLSSISSESMGATPRGLIAMWNGVSVPKGWALCNGQVVDGLQTPDLSGKFIVGWAPGNNDYKTIGNTGGQERVTLNVSELPEHSHTFDDAYHIEHTQELVSASGKVLRIGSDLSGSGDTDRDNSYAPIWTHDTEKSGRGESHENRPPYYVLAYIIKL